MKLQTTIAKGLSIIGHPMLVILYVLFLYIKINPYLFPYSSEKDLMTVILIIFFTSVLIPLIAMLLMLGVGFISSLEMKEREERIGPLIVIAIAYLWLYLNIRTHSMIPIPYARFVLGALIAIFLAFFINNFSKISLHGVGVGGMLVAVLLLVLKHGQQYISWHISGNNLEVHSLVLLMGLLVLCGAVLSSRLYLKAHTNQDIIGGVVVGALGQMVANTFF